MPVGLTYMDHQEIRALLEKYNNGQATDEEKALLETWYNKDTNGKAFDLSAEDIENDIQEVFVSLPGPDRTISIWPRIAAAASIILCLGIGGYFAFHSQLPKKQIAQVQHQDAAPGGNKAILTLSDGSQISLNNAHNGALASQGNVTIHKNKDGQIAYDPSENDGALLNNGYNTVITPRGGQFQLILSDGTKVWLNAASSIKYPAVFKGNERRVELAGEAYFEVAHNKAKPFRVTSNGQTVEVLGTHFNINAYNNENAIRTTLLEGSVRVSIGSKNKVIKPGEQAQLKNEDFQISTVDVNEVIAWKNGLFQFKDTNLIDVMRQLSRWYDVDIKYQGNIPDRKFSGSISRNVNASQLLDILSFEKIHFRIEGKTIIVTP